MKGPTAITIIVLALTVAFQAFSQTPQRPSDDELNAMFATLAEQRNASQNQVAQLAAKITTLEKAVKEAQAKECKPETKKEVAK